MFNHHLWLVVVMLVVISMFYYHEQLGIANIIPYYPQILPARHSLDRILLLFPIIYAGWKLGIWGGFACILAAFFIMMPRVIYFTSTPMDALAESISALIIGVIAIIWLYTYRKYTVQLKIEKQEMQESYLRYKSLFDNAFDAIWLHDLEGNIYLANEAASKLTGYTSEEMSQANIAIFLSRESLRTVGESQQKLIKGVSRELPKEMTIVKKDGTEATCMAATNLIADGHKQKRFQSIVRDITEERRLQRNLHYYLHEITRAQEDERRHIAQDLHDSTAQTLIALMHQVDNLIIENTKLPVKATRSLKMLHKRIGETLQEVRQFSRHLRPSILDDLGLIAALEWLVDEFNKEHKIKSKLKIAGLKRRLPQEVELVLFRIVQESLNNAGRHSRASRAEVAIEFSEPNIRVSVTDNGAGFKVPRNLVNLSRLGKLGLIGMQERLQSIDGSLQLKSGIGKGTSVIAEVRIQ